MAKDHYKIPASLDENYLNMEIALQSKDGVGVKPLPVRVILVWLVGLLIMVYAVINGGSPIAQAGIGMQVLFGAVWLCMVFVLSQMDKSHRMQIELLPAAINYMQKQNRSILTRKTSNANPFHQVVGINAIDPKTGLVTYADGTYAYWYSVVGNASVLLFKTDQDMILDRVDDFYRKMQPDCEILFVTTKEAQRVKKQMAHLMAQYKALEYKDSDIDLLVREQYDALKNFVGKEFKSLHQYMIIKGDNREALSAINSIVISEYQSSPLMLKRCVPMYQADIEEVLKLIYGGGEQ